MDKFILRTPRSLEDSKPTKLKESKLKQSTIKSLRVGILFYKYVSQYREKLYKSIKE